MFCGKEITTTFASVKNKTSTQDGGSRNWKSNRKKLFGN